MSTLILPGVQVTPSTTMKRDKMRVLLHGQPGSGKTYLASTIAQLGKTLVVDMVSEKGGLSYRGSDWEKNIDIVRPNSITDFPGIYNFLAKGNHEYQAVILDSLSATQKTAERWLLNYSEDAVSEIRKGRAGPSMQVWGNILNIMTDICTFWMSLADGDSTKPMHVVFTSQTRAQGGDDQREGKFYPDVSKGSRGIAMAAPDYVLFTEQLEVPADDGSGMKMKHVAHIGASDEIATKARIPVNLHGKVPDVLGMGDKPLSLATLAKTLGIA